MLIYDVNDLYNDLEYRLISVFFLNSQAYSIFKDSLLLNNYSEIFDERIKMADIKKRMTYDYPITDKFQRSYVLENVKIALALEIHLKSLLLSKDYIVHLIKSGKLKSEQKSRPISIQEYLNEFGNDFSNTNLKKNSLNLSSFINPDYIKAINVDSDMVDIIEQFRSLRNAVHLPINIPTGLPLENDKILRLVRYINEGIIDFTCRIAEDNNMNRNFNFPKF